MANASGIREHMEVIGADGVHVGTVDKVEDHRIKLTKQDSGQGDHEGHHHFLSTGLVAGVEGDKVRLSATAANAFMFREEDSGSAHYVTDAAFAEPASRTATVGGDKGPDWTSIGLGAAALGLMAGAALLTRRNIRRPDEFELRLQTDENIRLISSAKVEGTPVVGRDGDRLGRIENFMVDKYTGRVAYAVMSFGGTFGFGESLFPLPWSYLVYDSAKDGYVLGLTAEQLANAPRFKPSEAPEFSTSYRQNLSRYYDGAVS